VTDYSAGLAAIPAGLGMQVLFLSIYPFVPEDYFSRIPGAARKNIQVHQPSTWGKTSLAALATALTEFSPDLVLFQFSRPVFRTGRRLYPYLHKICAALRPYPVLLMVHETWTNVEQPSGPRKWLLSLFRRTEILMSWRHLGVVRAYASNPNHLAQLHRAGLSPQPLPIFSNIPPSPRPPSIELKAVLTACGISDDAYSRLPANPYIALFFGRISPHWIPVHLFDSLRCEARSAGRPLLILSVGETGYFDQGWQNVIRQAAPSPCVRLGRRSVAEITQCLHVADCGLTPNSLGYWLKSGTCAAMVGCGLPIVFPQTDIPADIPLPPRFATIGPQRLDWHLPAANRIAQPSSPLQVWQQVERDLLTPDVPFFPETAHSA
jgi:hypothetical protein